MTCQNKVRKADKETRANWAELDADMLRIISWKLCDTASFIKFRAVCKRWRSATDLSDCPRQFPCLIDWPGHWGKELRVYSPASRKSHFFRIPKSISSGPFCGDVLITSLSHKRVFYLNPVTRVERNLTFEIPLDYFGFPPSLVWLNSEDEFAVVHEVSKDAFYFVSKNDQWTKKIYQFRTLGSAVYYRGKYFLSVDRDIECTIVVIDKTSGTKLQSMPFLKKVPA